ncbi:Rieske (2Fe-2S) protein [Desulfuromonas sp. KJ2020]|uniref:QcrA and Rieske domain-containing protein n=1 Tax=Desulfuromonas sp. KJ2020 TaxID=2919173 RepID=UPI0020A6F640|nr:Rieske (2Fe-2S) protein [Desulfuromonas sp. KJ2020]MCP3176962.1 Rieske (2Fe-2S) protein [Desulfuromonas sp. KJ2020]
MNRRQWLFRAISMPALAVAGAALGGIFSQVWLAAGRFSSRHWSDVTAVDSLPEEGTSAFPGQRVALLCRGEDIGALSLECTHLGCLLNTVDQGFFCPCHGSEFASSGKVLSGPASRDLDWLPVRIQNGRVWIQGGTRLDSPLWIKRG